MNIHYWCRIFLQRVALELLDVGLYAAELTRNRDALRTVFDALLASDAVAGLTDGRDGAVVAHEIDPAQFAVVLLLGALGDLPFVDALIVMFEYTRNVNSVRARP